MGHAARDLVHVGAQISIDASPDVVSRCYRDVARWPQLFPATIAGAQVTARTADALVVRVVHRQDGLVENRLRLGSDGAVELTEDRSCYWARFVNRFEPRASATRYAIDAELRFKGTCRFATLLPRWVLALLVRRRMRRYVLEPVKQYVERLTWTPAPDA